MESRIGLAEKWISRVESPTSHLLAIWRSCSGFSMVFSRMTKLVGGNVEESSMNAEDRIGSEKLQLLFATWDFSSNPFLRGWAGWPNLDSNRLPRRQNL